MLELTIAALDERKWGAFPALRKVLEGKPKSDRYFRPISVSDNIFEAFNRFLDISASATKHKDELCRAVRGDPQFADAVIHDLLKLMKELERIREHLDNEVWDLDRLCGEVHHAFRIGAP